MPKYTGIRRITSFERVQVEADNFDEAREKFEDDDNDVRILSETDGDYEVSEMDEVKGE